MKKKVRIPFSKDGKITLANDYTRSTTRNGTVKEEINTPVAMIRKMLRMSRKEFSVACNININTLYLLDMGKIYPSPLMAKRIQEVARRNGLAVTLDEMYQNLILDFNELLSSMNGRKKRDEVSINHESPSPVDPADSSQS